MKKNWFNFIAFGFCIGMAVSAFLNGNWQAGLTDIGLSLLNVPFMIGG